MLSALALGSYLLLGAASAPPIAIDECTFQRSGSFERSVLIKYRNTSSRTAVAVSYRVHNGPHSIVVTDHGSFAPNTTIDHTLPTPTWELSHAEVHACVVTAVHFSDGSEWTEPK